jgi:hypothetical protein
MCVGPDEDVCASWSVEFWLFGGPMIFRPGGGGGGASGVGMTDKQKRALLDCIKSLFGITTTSFTEASKGNNGSFSGTTADGKPISVTTDVNSLSTATMNFIFYGQDKPPLGSSDIQGLTLSGVHQTGSFTIFLPLPMTIPLFKSFSLSTNYVANDVFVSYVWQNQVHELGHDLARQLGLESGTGSEDDNPNGRRLQDCVIQASRK